MMYNASPRAVRGLSGTEPPDPTLESASPSPPQGRFGIESRVKSGNRCQIDAQSTPEEGRARQIGEREADSRVRSRGPVPNDLLSSPKGTI